METTKEKIEKAQDRTVTIGEYSFDEVNHIHALRGKPLMGTSSVTKNITEFGVAAYYGSRRAMMELGYDPKMSKKDVKAFREKMIELQGLEDDSLSTALFNCYKAHATYSTARAKKGTTSHDIIDTWIKKCIAENNGQPMPSDEPKVKEFVNLTKHLNPRFIASEKHGYNEELWLGGIADVIVETSLGLGIWDMKDRPAIYGKDILQMGGYTLLFPMQFTHVMGIPLEGKEPRIFYDIQGLQEAFKHQLGVYKFMQAVEPKQ